MEYVGGFMFMYNLESYCVYVLAYVTDYKQNVRNEK